MPSFFKAMYKGHLCSKFVLHLHLNDNPFKISLFISLSIIMVP